MADKKTSGSSPIQFRRESLSSRILKRDSSGAFTEAVIPLEFRFDPLTGRTCRLVAFSLERILRPDLTHLVQRSLELGCPFCSPTIEKITPRFPPEIIPEGTIRWGKALAFPNIGPYDVYGAVVVISDKHFISLGEFTLETVLDALLAAQSYIKSVSEADPAAKYHFIAWNYMPPSGGSLIHPHIQCNAGYFPTVYEKEMMEASQRYRERTGKNFWNELIEQEKKTGARYIGTIGNTCWLTSFAPRGRLGEVLVVFPGRASVLELTEEDLRDLAAGLLNVFGYLDGLNLISFNLATCSGTDRNQFWAHVRIMPRSLLLYSPIETSDQFYYQVLHDENICILSSEAACQGLRKRFIT
jgi:UDPglucose--hexose-1-phosphate uridylyltransferase